jgi:hypothetical protein
MGAIASVVQVIVANVTVTANANIGGSPTTTVTTQGDHNLKVGDSVTGAGGFICGYLAEIRAIVAAVPGSRTVVLYYDASSYAPGTYTPTAGAYIARDEFYRDNYIAVDLVEIHLKNSAGASSPLYLCNGGFNLNYASPTAPNNPSSNTYLAQGEFIGFSELAETFDVALGKFTIYLSGVGTDYLNRFTVYPSEGQRVVVYKAFLEYTTTNGIESLGIVPSPLMMFDGIVFNVVATENGSSCQINLECSTLFADFDRTAGRTTSTFSNWLFQGYTYKPSTGAGYDTCFDQTGFIGESNFLWGRE